MRSELERIEQALLEIQGHSGGDPIRIENIAEEALARVRDLLAEHRESGDRPRERAGRDRFHRHDCAEVLVPGQACNCAELDAEVARDAS